MVPECFSLQETLLTINVVYVLFLNVTLTFDEVAVTSVDAALALIAATDESAHTAANAVNAILLILLAFCFID